MEEGEEKNKEWENFCWTVDEDMFTYVMKSSIEKFNQEFPEEVETRENQDFESDEEMTTETEELTMNFQKKLTMPGGQTKQRELFIALTHEDHKPIIFDRVMKAGNSVLLAAKMVIKNPKEVNAVIVNGKQSKENTCTE